jgi:hypothetical protein
MTTLHIAARVDEGLDDRDLRYFPTNPHSTDPVDWAQAFLLSEDVSGDAVYIWFENAMHAARFGYYDPDPSMPWD